MLDRRRRGDDLLAIRQLRLPVTVDDLTVRCRGYPEGQGFASVVGHQMEIEAVEPAHRGLATAGHFLEDVRATNAVRRSRPSARADVNQDRLPHGAIALSATSPTKLGNYPFVRLSF